MMYYSNELSAMDSKSTKLALGAFFDTMYFTLNVQ